MIRLVPLNREILLARFWKLSGLPAAHRINSSANFPSPIHYFLCQFTFFFFIHFLSFFLSLIFVCLLLLNCFFARLCFICIALVRGEAVAQDKILAVIELEITSGLKCHIEQYVVDIRFEIIGIRMSATYKVFINCLVCHLWTKSYQNIDLYIHKSSDAMTTV